MENTLMIRALKAKIKELCAEQVLLKKARKTTMPQDQWEALRVQLLAFNRKPNGWIPIRDKGWTPWHAALEASINSDRITACLNYYHELRDSKYRHNVGAGFNYWCNDYITELKAELAKIK